MKNKKFTKIVLGLLITVFMTSPFIVSGAVDRLDELNNKLNDDKAALNSKKIEVSEAKNQLDIVNKQLTATESNISKLNSDIKSTEDNIQATEVKILKNKQTLKKLVQLLYEQQKTNTFELLASAGSVTDLINAEEYNRSVDEKINSTITENKELKNSLVTQKQQLTDKKVELDKELQNQRVQQAAQKALFSQRSHEQASIEKQIKLSESEKAKIVAERKTQSRRVGGGTGGYLWANGNPNLTDDWGYYQKECVSYVAWKWNYVYGKPWYRVFKVNHGNTFDEAGAVLGYSVSNTPRVGAIMVWNTGFYGHVAIVEEVYSPTSVKVSHYNWEWDHAYSTDIVSVGSYNKFVY